MKILFVCTYGEQRSVAARDLINERGKHEAKSCGINPMAETCVSREAVLWADEIFCMEEKQKKFILDNFPDESRGKKIHVLGIESRYRRDDPKLKEILRKKLKI